MAVISSTAVDLQLRLMWGVFSNANDIVLSLVNDIPPHQPLFQASSSPIPGINKIFAKGLLVPLQASFWNRLLKHGHRE